ncbi:hypothetical protein WM36_17195 [Burkholderia ubonensis]|uniref:hypothetical protein n=1 Tax=Burkholderia ubonensis TaxID=101571 RepID=UPI00076024E5|nr:hypothetical protein [Burkholderia ubonensis]KVA74082.1 hypothetical protein WM36_17195 [Burkholderia ubonensis]
MGEVVEWDLLERRAASMAFQAQEAAAAPLPGEPEPIDPAAELLDMLKMARDYLAPLLPYVPAIYTDEVLTELAAKTVPVLDKYGLSVAGVGDLFGPELRLLVLVAPLAYVTYRTHKAYKAAELEARTVDAAPAAAATPPAEPVRVVVPVRDTGGQLQPQGA